MELFRFIAWQCKRFDYEEIALMVMILATIATVSLCIYLGASAGWLFVNATVAFIGTGLLAGAIHMMRAQWWKYKKFQELEAQKIVDKLRGRSY